MGESKREIQSNEKDGAQKSDSDATSKETLSEVRESEKDSSSSPDKSDSGLSPDGALDESDESKDAGPM